MVLEWIRDELAPYPGRATLVARMVIAATLVTIICLTFRIPYAWQGAIYALLVSRESPRATLKSAATIFLVTGIAAAYIIVSMKLVINIPALHFLWIIATLFVDVLCDQRADQLPCGGRLREYDLHFHSVVGPACARRGQMWRIRFG